MVLLPTPFNSLFSGRVPDTVYRISGRILPRTTDPTFGLTCDSWPLHSESLSPLPTISLFLNMALFYMPIYCSRALPRVSLSHPSPLICTPCCPTPHHPCCDHFTFRTRCGPSVANGSRILGLSVLRRRREYHLNEEPGQLVNRMQPLERFHDLFNMLCQWLPLERLYLCKGPLKDGRQIGLVFESSSHPARRTVTLQRSSTPTSLSLGPRVHLRNWRRPRDNCMAELVEKAGVPEPGVAS